MTPTPAQIRILLRAARAFAARHTSADPEITYHYQTAAARLRSTGRRALVRAGHDHDLPRGGEAFMTAVVRHILTEKEPTIPSTSTTSTPLTGTSDDTLTALITALATYLDHRTTARLHHTKGLRTWSRAQQTEADQHRFTATRLLATIGRGDSL